MVTYVAENVSAVYNKSCALPGRISFIMYSTSTTGIPHLKTWS